jgi:DNA polymerase-3 subunit chi
MTEVSFHSKVPDLIDYTCRLVRKAVRRGARVAVAGDGELLGRLDRALWTFDPLEFLPHVRLAPGVSAEPRLQPTPVWLVEDAVHAPVHEVLVNLGPSIAGGFERFDRVFEIVGRDVESAQAGRARWRHYADRGYNVAHHEAAA